MVTVMAFTGYLNFADAGLSWGSMVLIAHAHGRGDRAMIAHITRHSAVLAAGSGLVALLGIGGVEGAASLGWRLPMFAGHPEANSLIFIAGLQLVMTLQFGVFYNVFKGLQENYWTSFYQGLGRLLGLGGAMLTAWLTHSVAKVMVVQLVFSTLTGIAASVHACRRHSRAFSRGSWFDREQYRAQIRIGGKNFFIQIGQTLASTAPTFGISSILGPASVPFYTVPLTLLGMFFTPINSWSASMQNAYGEAWASGAFAAGRAAPFRQTGGTHARHRGTGHPATLSRIRQHVHRALDPRPPLAGSMWISASGVNHCRRKCHGQGGGIPSHRFLNRHRLAAVAEVANGLPSHGLRPSFDPLVWSRRGGCRRDSRRTRHVRLGSFPRNRKPPR